MSVLTEKLLFVIQRKAVSYIQSRTSLTPYAIRQFKLGKIPNVNLDRYSINAMYRTEARKYAYEVGMSTSNARRVRDWSYQRMQGAVSTYKKSIDDFASKVIAQKSIRDRNKGIYIDYDTYYRENIEWIKDAFRKSKKSMEEIEDNPYESP